MIWHMVHDTATGEGVSIGSVIADPLPDGLTATPLTDADADAILAGTLAWDSATRSTIPTIVTPPNDTQVDDIAAALANLPPATLAALRAALGI